jgi:NAD(P)-dependent dehydrogenase (short-subunit alcohol dehydrogenase family)
MGLEIFELKDKVALVTGSTRGLGEVSARALAGAGADIAVCGRSAEDLKRVTGEILKSGRTAEGFFIDVTSKQSVAEAVDRILERFGRIDILVNNAGVNYRVPVLEYPENE